MTREHHHTTEGKRHNGSHLNLCSTDISFLGKLTALPLLFSSLEKSSSVLFLPPLPSQIDLLAALALPKEHLTPDFGPKKRPGRREGLRGSPTVFGGQNDNRGQTKQIDDCPMCSGKMCAPFFVFFSPDKILVTKNQILGKQLRLRKASMCRGWGRRGEVCRGSRTLTR